MADLVVIVPSKRRPQAAHELFRACVDTCMQPTRLVFVIDKSDADGIYDYPFAEEGQVDAVTCWTDSATMVEALNLGAAAILRGDPGFSAGPAPFAIGFMGDDHRPRTVGWDAAYLDALHEFGTGLVYGNDLLQGPRIPTQVAMTADIVRALGYMAPPEFTHLWVDNFWLELGQALGRIRYLPDVVVEHMHPLAGKGEWDDGYLRVNSQEVAGHDQLAFNTYIRTRFGHDVDKVRALIGAPA